MEKLTKKEAEQLIRSIRPDVASISHVTNIRWSGEFDLSFKKSFNVIAVCDYVGDDERYAVTPSQIIFEKFEESDGGILTILTPHDTRVWGNWGVIDGLVWREEKIYRVV